MRMLIDINLIVVFSSPHGALKSFIASPRVHEFQFNCDLSRAHSDKWSIVDIMICLVHDHARNIEKI